MGACDSTTKTIYISSHLYGQKLKKVLCHELAHAVFASYQISLTQPEEEQIANLFALYGETILTLVDIII